LVQVAPRQKSSSVACVFAAAVNATRTWPAVAFGTAETPVGAASTGGCSGSVTHLPSGGVAGDQVTVQAGGAPTVPVCSQLPDVPAGQACVRGESLSGGHSTGVVPGENRKITFVTV
jgi:hypothetical protein